MKSFWVAEVTTALATNSGLHPHVFYPVRHAMEDGAQDLTFCGRRLGAGHYRVSSFGQARVHSITCPDCVAIVTAGRLAESEVE